MAEAMSEVLRHRNVLDKHHHISTPEGSPTKKKAPFSLGSAGKKHAVEEDKVTYIPI